MTETIYIQNKYHNWYKSIIKNAQQLDRKKGRGTYYELHHIIPKSIGGYNSKSNLVLLTAKEHFICHHLLTKFTEGVDLNKMVTALFLMCNNTEFKVTSSIYERLKINHSKNMSEINTGMKRSINARINMSKSATGRKLSIETKIKLSESKTGIKHPKFKGYYITPWGKFDSSYVASSSYVSNITIINWCKNSNNIILNGSIRQSNYLKPEHLGKTFKELGFDFELLV